jgi:hypothetical protein
VPSPAHSDPSRSSTESAGRAPCRSVTSGRGHSPCRWPTGRRVTATAPAKSHAHDPVAGARKGPPMTVPAIGGSCAKCSGPFRCRWPGPAFPLMRAGPRDRSSKLGPGARAYCAGLRRRCTAARRTTERLLTWPYAGMHVHVPVSGGQGFAGSNPAVPTVFRTLLRHVQQQYSSTRGRQLRSACGL